MEAKIVDELKNRFNPAAIILHGSRAGGHERAHSDWDFILLVGHSGDLRSGRLLFSDQNVEYQSVRFSEDIDVMKTFGIKLQYARVVFDTDNAGAGLLQRAQDIYQQGPQDWTPEKIESHRLFMRGRIDAMRDTAADKMSFFRALSTFYLRVPNLWFELVKKEFSKPVYIGFPIIKEEDSDYYRQIETLVSLDSSNEEKIDAAERVYERLFS